MRTALHCEHESDVVNLFRVAMYILFRLNLINQEIVKINALLLDMRLEISSKYNLFNFKKFKQM